MNNKYIKWPIAIIIIVIVVFIINKIVTTTVNLGIRNGGPVKIGIIGPLSGPAGAIGEEVANAVKLASSTTLSLFYEDDQCDAKKAISAYMRLVQEDVHIFHLACSGSVIALAPIVKKDGNLIVTGYAGSSEIRNTGDEVIRFIPDAVSIAGVMADYISTDVATSSRLGLLYEDQNYSKSAAETLRSRLTNRIIETESYSADDQTFRTQIAKLKSNRIDTLLYIPTSDKAAKIIYGEMRSLGFSPHVVGDVNVCGYISPKEFGIKTTCFDSAFVNETPGYKRFIDEYKSVYKVDSVAPFYDAVTYDIIKVLDVYGNLHKGVIDISELKTYLLKGVDGLMSHYSFTANGEVIGDGYIKKVEK